MVASRPKRPPKESVDAELDAITWSRPDAAAATPGGGNCSHPTVAHDLQVAATDADRGVETAAYFMKLRAAL